MASIDYLIREIWEDGSETLYVARGQYTDELTAEEESRHWAIKISKERWDCAEHVFGEHGTSIIRPKAFEILGSTKYNDRRYYWHPNTTLSNLTRGVFLKKEEEHYYEYA